MKPQLSVVCKPDGWETLPPEGLTRQLKTQGKWERDSAGILISQSQTGKVDPNKETSSLSMEH